MPHNSRRKKIRRRIRWNRIFACLFSALLLSVGTALLIQVSNELSYSAADAAESDIPRESSASLPEETAPSAGQQAVLPEGWEWAAIPEESLYTGPLILVNADYAYQAGTEAPVSVFDYKTRSYQVKDKNVTMMEEAILALNDMMDAFYAKSGLSDVLLVSGWRDPALQQELYEDDLSETGRSQSTLVAIPGHSEHHTGLCLDFGLMPSESGESRTYDGTGAYAWLNENCADYGYVVRYPADKTDITKIEYEPWHFRYVSKPHAQIMTETSDGLCLEEYIELLKQYPLDGEHLRFQDYEICWQQPQQTENGLRIAVPADRDYTISGDNTGGIILTISGSGSNDNSSRG